MVNKLVENEGRDAKVGKIGRETVKGLINPTKVFDDGEVRLGGRNWCKGIFGLVSKVRWVIEDSFFNDGVCEKLIVILVRAGGEW